MLNRRTLLVTGFAGLGAGCTTTTDIAGTRGDPMAPARLPPLRLDAQHLMRITVCTRPFRASGPRLEAEQLGNRLVVHNYGHGGSGWSLSWGCAEEASTLVLQGEQTSIAVVGAGIIGLTTALTLLERGLDVTVYARDLPAESRSARATGVWSPSSRIALAGAVDAGFAARWESWARSAWSRHQSYIGTPGTPVEFVRQYDLGNGGLPSGPKATRDFLHLGWRIRTITPKGAALPAARNPFRTGPATTRQGLTFNIAAYSDRLVRDILLRGGKIVRRNLASRAEILDLPQPVIVNCTGYDSRHLWDDESVAPVRGQVGWFVPQPAARYGLSYRNVFVLSRSDGVIVQYLGENEDWGYGDDFERVDPEETSRAIETLAPLFSRQAGTPS